MNKNRYLMALVIALFYINANAITAPKLAATQNNITELFEAMERMDTASALNEAGKEFITLKNELADEPQLQALYQEQFDNIKEGILSQIELDKQESSVTNLFRMLNITDQTTPEALQRALQQSTETLKQLDAEITKAKQVAAANKKTELQNLQEDDQTMFFYMHLLSVLSDQNKIDAIAKNTSAFIDTLSKNLTFNKGLALITAASEPIQFGTDSYANIKNYLLELSKRRDARENATFGKNTTSLSNNLFDALPKKQLP